MTCHGNCHHCHSSPGHSNQAISYVIDQSVSPPVATLTLTPRSPFLTQLPLTFAGRSPLLAVSPLPGVSQLSNAFGLVSINSAPSSPAVSTVVLTTPSINPLVAFDQGPPHSKIHYDVSKDLDHVRVSRPRGHSAPITDEQKRSLVVEGVPHMNFRIVIDNLDHPGLPGHIDFEGTLTVGGLLDELHSEFHQRVGARELSDLRKDMNVYHAAVSAQVKRCGTAFDGHTEWERGMKRVDILGKESKFHGIYLDPSYIDDCLTLHVVFGK